MLKIVEKERAVLTVIDIQEKLLPAIYNKDEVVTNTIKLIKLAELFRIPVIVTEQYPKGLGKTVPDIENALHDLKTKLYRVEKLTFSCVREPEYTEILNNLRKSGYNEMIICGIESHICVLQTCMDLKERGYEVHLAYDATGSRQKKHHKVAYKYLLEAKINVKPTESIIFEILERAATDKFKAMLNYLK